MSFNNYDLLEIIEEFAVYNGLIASEVELSERFDKDVMPGILKKYGQPGKEFDDTGMINEAFNNWTDLLCKDGEIHEAQYNSYEYVGEWS